MKPKKFKNFFRHEKSPHKTYSFIRAIKAIKYSVFISKNPAKPDTATVKIIQKTVFRPYNEENIITINAKDYYIEYFNTNVYDIKFGKKGEGINMGGPKWVGENYFTWLNNYGFFPKVTEIEIEYVFDNVKSVENLEVQVGVVRR